MYTADSGILGQPRATPAQCSRFILARPHGDYTERDIVGAIVPAYFATCAAVGVDPVLVVAQLIHETGNLSSWWAQRPRRNPAGIGVTGRSAVERPHTGAWVLRGSSWLEGVAFASWAEDAIPAHVGRVLAYALPDSQASVAQRALISRALGYRSLPSRLRGVAPTWRGLNGRWAVPGATYADRIAEIANAILRR